MMGLGKPQRLAKFENTGCIFYGNMIKLAFKILDKPKWGNPLLFGQSDFIVGFPDPMFPIRCATVVELRLQQMVDFLRKTFRGCKLVGVENFCSKLPKGTRLRQIWSNKSFGVCGSDVV